MRWAARHALAAIPVGFWIMTFVAVAVSPARGGETRDPFLGVLDPGTRPALGLGDDPFLSPIDDDVGWWASGSPVATAWTEVQLTSRAPVTRAWTGGHGTVAAFEPAWKLASSQELLGRTWVLWSEIASPRWDRSWQNDSNAFDVNGTMTRLQLGARVEDVLPGLSTQFTVPVWHTQSDLRGSRFKLGVRYDLMHFLRTQAAWGRSDNAELMHFDLENEPWSVSTNLALEERQFDTRLSLPLGFAAEGHLARADIGTKRARDTQPTYHFEPGGRFDAGDAALLWHGRRMGLVYRWTRKSLDSDGRFSWGGQEFGHVTYARARVESHLVGVQSALGRDWRWLLDAEHAQLRAKARGQVESWPFTETLVDLLGARYNGKAEFDARWLRIHSGAEGQLNERISTRFGLAWYRVLPDAYLDTWRPAFLVFGRADAKRTTLSIDEIHLAAISMGWGFQFAGLNLDMAARQFIPIRVDKSSRSASEDPPVPNPPEQAAPPPATSDGWHWPGGTYFELSLIRKL